MIERPRGYAHRIDIAADPAVVWRALTEQEQLVRWCSPSAQIRPRQGGVFRASVDRVTELEAHIDVFEPGRRMRLIYLPSIALPPAESAIVDDLILDSSEFETGRFRMTPPVAGQGETGRFPAGRPGTILRLLGSGIPATPEWNAQYQRMRLGWQQAMARLKVFVEKQLVNE